MANPKLIVEVAGDSRKLTRTLKQTETQTQAWARRMSAATGSSSLGILGGKGFLGAAAVGVGVASLKSIIDASANAQQVLGQTRVALEDAGLSWSKYGDKIQEAVAAQSRLGFDDEEQLKAISTFARATGDVNKALDLTALSADVARARYIDLASASNIVLKAQLGNAGALRRIGIDAQKGSSSIQLLTLLTQKYGGAAEAATNDATTANQRLRVSLQNIEEEIGSGVLPVVAQLAGALAESADQASNLVRALKNVDVPGLGNASGLDFGKAFKVGLAATPGLQLLAGESLLLKKLGLGSDESNKAGQQSGRSFAQGFKSGVGSSGVFGVTPLKPSGASNTPPRRGATAGQRNDWFDAGIARELDRNQDIGTIRGQINDLTRIGAEIQARINITKDITRKLRLEDELVEVNRRKRGLGEQLQADALSRKQEQQSLATEAKAREQQAAATRLAQRTARQFRELGLDAGGDAVTPGIANLKKRVGNIQSQIAGTKFDTPKLETQLARFRKVLSEGLVPKDVRSKIDAMLKEINDAINENAKSGGPLTATTQLNSERILAGLGLGRDAERTLRARLSHFNSAGKALSGAGSGSATAQPIVIPVHIDGRLVTKSVSKHQKRKQQANPTQRRGPNAGVVVN